ncbi:MAG TPA: histidine phosphatase family protein [Stellaceae bacterium]|jgi:phosphohistidine phosphatase|nr:histidine phosphatase family protein [Stellaceae bacterium]
MSELYLLRHAKAVSKEGDFRDIDRPLDERGREGARAIARWLKQNEITPELVLCSPAARTRETLDLVVGVFGPPPDIRYESGLYLADADRLLARLRDIADDIQRVMLIGHNPGIHELAQSLADVTSGPLASRLAVNLPTAGLARYRIEVEWSGLRRRGARLVGFVSPKDLEKD